MTNLAAAPAVGTAGVPEHFTAISISAAVVALLLAGLLKWRPLRRLEFLIPWLCLLAGIGFAAAFARAWANKLGAWTTAHIPYIGVAVVVGAAVVLLFIVLYDLWPKHPTNTMTAVAALLLPAVGPEIGGLVGAWLGIALGWIAVGGATLISTTFGV